MEEEEEKDATTVSRKEIEKEKNKQQLCVEPHLAEDCISNILLSLPVESLRRSILVSKQWYNIIKSSNFIDTHINRSENVLILASKAIQETSRFKEADSIIQENLNTFSVEAKLFGLPKVPLFHPLLDPRSKVFIRFMEIRDGKVRIGDFNLTCFGRIMASCNGLILLENKLRKGGLVVMNPVTREFSALPLGTLCSPRDESYGFAFCSLTSQYKLVHLFRDEMFYMNCEILDIGNLSWRVVDGPSPGAFTWLGYNPVSAIGALHWVPHIQDSDFIVSMSMDHEKFQMVPLPTRIKVPFSNSMKNCYCMLEMRGLLCLVAYKDVHKFDIWVLRGLCEEKWVKYHSIEVGPLLNVVPMYCTRMSGEMMFRSCQDKSMFAYDFKFQDMERVEMDRDWDGYGGCYMPHVNSLVSFGNGSGTSRTVSI